MYGKDMFSFDTMRSVVDDGVKHQKKGDRANADGRTDARTNWKR